jgi:hypothetical protein
VLRSPFQKTKRQTFPLRVVQQDFDIIIMLFISYDAHFYCATCFVMPVFD